MIVQGLGRGIFDGEDLPGGLKTTGRGVESRLVSIIVCGNNGIVRCTEYYDRLSMPGLNLG